MDREYTYRILRCAYNVFDELGYVINFNVEDLREGIHTVRNPYAKSADDI